MENSYNYFMVQALKIKHSLAQQRLPCFSNETDDTWHTGNRNYFIFVIHKSILHWKQKIILLA